MHKLFFLTLFALLSFLNADDKVEIYSSSITSKENIIEAHNGVTVVYKDYFLSANRALYNKKSGNLELFGNIKATHENIYRILGDYAKLNIAQKERLFKPFYMLEKSSDVWVSGDEGRAKDQNIEIKSGVVSGCNQNNPLWKMEFSSSDYNANTKWFNLYNTTLYLYDIPVLYMPYFGYSLDNSRRTGLLMPALGVSGSEGIYYEQAIYIAEQDWWDLEIRPQVRTNRGNGIYSNFRFVDSNISKGEFKVGYFKEYKKYFEEENLANDSHYGFNFKYENSDVVNRWFNSSLEGKSGLFIDINSMNDVDYINLSSNDNINTATATQVLSRVNLFYNTDESYIAAYFKYYLDLTKEDNDNTLQKLPTIHYHHYLDTYFNDLLFYNIDVKSNNIQRSVGKTVLQTDVNVPVTLQTTLFDELINVSYRANLYAQHSRFSNTEDRAVIGVEYDNGYFARNYHTLYASTELTRAFEEVTHVISFSSTYTLGGTESRTGFYKEHKDTCSDPLNQSNPECEFYAITDIDEAVELDFTQHLYDLEGEEIFYHRLAQRISYVGEQSRYGELENEFDYKVSRGLKLYNNMFYNFDESAFSKIFNEVSYSVIGLKLGLSHLYQDDFLPATLTHIPLTSYMTSSLKYEYNEHYTYNFRYDYDLKTAIKKSMEFGFMYKKRCWDFGIRYVENNRPVLTQSGESSNYDKYIYFTVALKPFMSSDNGKSDFSVKLP